MGARSAGAGGDYPGAWEVGCVQAEHRLLSGPPSRPWRALFGFSLPAPVCDIYVIERL